jgi:hypothetical protein
MRFSRSLFLAGFTALAAVAGVAPPASRAGLPFPLQLEMRVPFEPTAFPSGGQTYLAYELYLTNFAGNRIGLHRIEGPNVQYFPEIKALKPLKGRDATR